MGECVVWRLVRPEYAPGLDGEGARLAGGRWNSPGRPVVYCSDSLALAVLESFVHLPLALRGSARLPGMTAVKLRLPDDLELVEPDITAAQLFAPAACRALGDQWLEAGAAAALRVPAAVVPEERNVLINPRHSQASRVSFLAQERFRFDPRLGQ